MSYGDRERYSSFVTAHQLVNVDRGKLVSVMQNRQRLVSQITLVPEVADNRLTGYRVSYLAPDGDIAGMGIRENDLILSVNGAPASEPAGFVRSIDSLAEQTAFSIQIVRDNQLVSLDILLD
jgi:S1-C subfamily serine protease